MSALMRPDLKAIAASIRPGSTVLDLGCGDGALLDHLQQNLKVTAYGVENSPHNVIECVKRGVNVIQMDLEAGLSGFDDGSFDHVILSQTLQAMHHSASVLKEILRVGREGIVSFPNFGYWRNRLQIFAGHMPVSRDLPYAWHDTPNIHLCTLVDFETLCKDIGAEVKERRVLTEGKELTWLPNLRGSVAIYRIGRAS